MGDVLDTYDQAGKLWGAESLRRLPEGTYTNNIAEAVAYALEALRNPRPLTDPRVLRVGAGVALAAGERAAIVRIAATPEARDLHSKLVFTRAPYAVRGTHSGTAWLLFQPHSGIPVEGADLAPGFRLLGHGEVMPLPPTWLSRFDRYIWAGSSPFSGPVDPHPAPPPSEFPAELLTLLPKAQPEQPKKKAKP